MSVVVMLTLKTQDDQYDALVAVMKEALPETAAYAGAELIRMAGDPQTKTLTLYEVWDKLESQQAYMGWRTETGFIDKIGPMLAAPPEVKPLDDLF
ncbi:MAG: hypothetical protein AAGF90_19810 [Pseudomonadota bacterium]